MVIVRAVDVRSQVDGDRPDAVDLARVPQVIAAQRAEPVGCEVGRVLIDRVVEVEAVIVGRGIDGKRETHRLLPLAVLAELTHPYVQPAFSSGPVALKVEALAIE